ncbi:MAG: 23S rRNA (pseudouridine(1915)-N(3))-methyltransferase RlmH [Chitinophagaceae bacterium]
MKIQFWSIGKVNESFVKEGVELFTKRINHYYPAQWSIISPPKNAGTLPEADFKKKEADLVLALLQKEDYLILLDEKGKLLKSEELAATIQARGNESIKNIVFLIGGAFGVDASISKRANFTWSLSPLVFPHQLVRLILAEQVYRACTINRNEKYHHS